MTGITIAARYRSATREASVGGDLYEIIPTGYGIRVIIGDVRGQGPDAVPLARHVLSAFRRARPPRPRWNRWPASRPGHRAAPGRGGLRHRGAGPDRARRRTHHRQLRPSPAVAAPRRRAAAAGDRKAAPPLGLADDFTAFTASWRPGDRLLLYTDGLVESRTSTEKFFPDCSVMRQLIAQPRIRRVVLIIEQFLGYYTQEQMKCIGRRHDGRTWDPERLGTQESVPGRLC